MFQRKCCVVVPALLIVIGLLAAAHFLDVAGLVRRLHGG